MAIVHPVIVVPGITATYLRDEHVLPPDYVWTVMTKEFDRLALHPDDLRYEALEPARLVPGQLYEIAYRELIEELRHNLTFREEEPVPVYPFGYDWRMPLESTEEQLAQFVEEVIDRTKLMRHYAKAGYGDDPKVNLVGHSMGGLIIAGYLEKHGSRSRAHKVVSLATPFQGSFEAVIKVTTGTANLGTSPPSSREREAARITPALYYLMPDFPGGLTVAAGLPDNLFNRGAWQDSIVDSIAEFIRRRGAPRKASQRKQDATALLADLLGEAKAHRDRINSLTLSDAGLEETDWLSIVGVGAETPGQSHVHSVLT